MGDNEVHRDRMGRKRIAGSEEGGGTKITGRRQRKAAETRLALFRAATKLFIQRGFNNVTVEDITEAADVGKGTFFNYFPTKEHVLGVIAEIQLAKIAEAIRSSDTDEISVRAMLRQLALHLAEEPGRSPELARTIISSFLVSDVVRDSLRTQMKGGRRSLASLVARGQEQGEIARHLQKDAVTLQFQQMVMGTILLWLLNGTPSLTRSIEESFEHFWRAVAAPEKG